jgi:hypothetical protein
MINIDKPSNFGMFCFQTKPNGLRFGGQQHGVVSLSTLKESCKVESSSKPGRRAGFLQ